MRLYILRHGQSTNNAHQPRVPDPPLTDLGREQADRAAAALRAEEPALAALYVSPMRRALETALRLVEGLRLSPCIEPDVCEMGGLMTCPGLTRAELLRDFPTFQLPERVTEQGWWTPTEVEEAETAVYARAAQVAATLRERHAATEEAIAVVTHGTFGSALMSALLGLPPIGYARFPFYNAAISRLDLLPHPIEPDQPSPTTLQLLYHNSTAHLSPSQVS
jgi:2,3-bisphosphoglycerate-dependent phosphoglycerate mutase